MKYYITTDEEVLSSDQLLAVSRMIGGKSVNLSEFAASMTSCGMVRELGYEPSIAEVCEMCGEETAAMELVDRLGCKLADAMVIVNAFQHRADAEPDKLEDYPTFDEFDEVCFG